MSDPIEDITFDDIPPEISIISPSADSFINSASLGLSTNEVLETALVDWIWDEGEVDPIKEHTSKLVGGSLQDGEYPQVEFDPAPSLISGSWYNVTFHGRDRAGNSSSFNLGRLFFDNIPFEKHSPILKFKKAVVGTSFCMFWYILSAKS